MTGTPIMAQAAAEPKTKKCDIGQVLSPALIELLKTAPANPAVRSSVHAAVLVPVPEACQTFEEIKDWIEATLDPGKLQPKPANPGVAAGQGIRVPVSCSETVYGQCDWIENRSGSGEYELSREEILEAVNDALENEDGFSVVLDTLAEQLREAAADNPPNIEDDEGPNYDNHETTNSDGFTSEVRMDRLRSAVIQWLCSHDPELFERLQQLS